MHSVYHKYIDIGLMQIHMYERNTRTRCMHAWLIYIYASICTVYILIRNLHVYLFLRETSVVTMIRGLCMHVPLIVIVSEIDPLRNLFSHHS